MSRKALTGLQENLERKLPSKLRNEFNALLNAHAGQVSLAEKGAFLVGLYAGRGGVR